MLYASLLRRYSLPLVLACLLASAIAPVARAQVPVEEFEDDPVELPTYEEPPISRPLTRDSSILSLLGGQRLLAEANSALAAQDYPNAEQKLQEARRVFNQLSNFYQQLSGTFSGIDNRISDDQRRTALETAQLRDQATYELALVHIAQGQPDLAVPLLIQIVRSQNPTTGLGRDSYERLFDIGFVEAPLEEIGESGPDNVETIASGFGGSGNMLLSQQGGDRLLERASNSIAAQDYGQAREQFQEARQVFNQLSNFYQELAGSFSGIDGRLSETLRRSALNTAESRDEATYQLALVHRAQDQSELAVPLLIQIVRSQNPTTPLGRKAYQQLFELGFVETPYPRYAN